MRQAITLLLLFVTAPVFAHELRPAYLEMIEANAGEFRVLWKTPMRGAMRLALSPVFSGRTKNLTPINTRHTDNAAVQRWWLQALDPLRGQVVRIAGLQGTMTDALVRIAFADGTAWTQRLTAAAPAAKIPVRPSGLTVAGIYLKLGVDHILSGIDHLLFVLALLLITRGGWKLVKTVSAFTLSHSVTLTAATLGFVHVPQRPVEAIIALSIVFVALEIVHLHAGREGVTARAPWVVAFTFGLLHGLGFAGGLSEVGLPAGHIPTALLFFSVGVETGHLLFVAAVLSLLALWCRVGFCLPRWAELVPPYAIGSVAMFWLLQRITAF
jgi:hydrogenase/urease accessory protein HupE